MNSAAEDLGANLVGRIPIRNVWHMFVYAWDLIRIDHRRVGSEIESSPSPCLLVANVLATALERRARYGLPRGYVNSAGEVGAIRGRIDVLESVRAFAFERGRVCCVYDAYSEDTDRNQIIKATVKQLVDAPELQHQGGADIRVRLNRCLRGMRGISATALNHDSFRNRSLGRNDMDDALVLSLCELLFRMRMPTERSGASRLLEADRDKVLFRKVFERFVWRFLERALTPKGWGVEHNRQLKWPVQAQSAGLCTYLPGMEYDIKIASPQGEATIIDTKFTEILGSTEHGTNRFKSSHIYQVYTYCYTQRDTPEAPAEAILLYPAIDQTISEFVQLPGIKLRFETIDLKLPWQEIEENLSRLVLSLTGSAPTPHCAA